MGGSLPVPGVGAAAVGGLDSAEQQTLCALLNRVGAGVRSAES